MTKEVIKMKKTIITFFVFGLLFLMVTGAQANLTYVYNTPYLGQDVITVSGTVDELGNPPTFAYDEAIFSSYTETSYAPCSVNDDDPDIFNYAVSITNMTDRSFTDLYYVADPETSLTNYDQSRINGQLAFRIDNVGLNTPLIYESYAADLIFSPGETWTFVIEDYVNTFGLAPSLFGSLGVGSASSSDLVSSGSIITPVPEPATMILLGSGLLGLGGIRRRFFKR